ncbi:MAG TPA: helix-turn-helix transcriptional regulator [Chitinophagales bacterium]|nr:helix-turn-helix transcriptional regulator [Chitinophagales bacterium]
MEIGTKIRKLRELKGLSQENMAYELDMSIAGYGKIERNEVSVNYDKLLKISETLNVRIEDIIGFDEKVAFNNFNSKIQQQIGRYTYADEIKLLYEDKIKLLEDKIILLEELNRTLKLKIENK